MAGRCCAERPKGRKRGVVFGAWRREPVSSVNRLFFLLRRKNSLIERTGAPLSQMAAIVLAAAPAVRGRQANSYPAPFTRRLALQQRHDPLTVTPANLDDATHALLSALDAAVAAGGANQLFAGGVLEGLSERQLATVTRARRIWHFFSAAPVCSNRARR